MEKGEGLHDKFPAFAFRANTRKEWIGIGGKVSRIESLSGGLRLSRKFGSGGL